MAKTDEEYWTEKADEIVRTQLETVRSAATSWSALFTAVLGVFAAASFAGGLPTLDKLPDAYQAPVKLATLLAVALTLAATILAGFASGARVVRTNDQSWQAVRDLSKSSAETAYTRLHRAKMCGLAAGVLIVAGSVTIFVVGEDAKPPKPPFIVGTVDGSAVCGRLTKAKDGTLHAGDASLSNAQSLTVVAACP